MTVVVVILLAVAACIAVATLATRVNYLRNHPTPTQRQMRPWLIGLVVASAAAGIGIGMATGSGTTLADAVKSVVLMALVVAYAVWRFGSSRQNRK